jgi:squalene-hopene/tetraprenyl-beta-curcumene cyclase
MLRIQQRKSFHENRNVGWSPVAASPVILDGRRNRAKLSGTIASIFNGEDVIVASVRHLPGPTIHWRFNMRRLSALMTAGLVAVVFSQAAFADDPAPQYEAGEIKVPPAAADEPVIDFSLEKASQHLEYGSVAWGQQRNCVSCHTNGTYLFIRPALTPMLGKPGTATRDFFVSQLKMLSEQETRKLKRSGTRPAQVIYIAAGLAEWDAHVSKQLSPETDQALRLMFELQDDMGTWFSLTCWPPFESSAYQEAHMAAMAVASAPGWVESLPEDDAVRGRIDLLKKYIRETAPPHDYARVLQLWTALRLDGILDADQKADATKLLLSKQQTDGGWSIRQFSEPEQWGEGNRAAKLRAEPEFDSPPSDGHMTGLALLVLQESGVPSDRSELQRGLDWIRKNQRESGRWWTRSLNTDKWHFITYSGTAYPLLALQNANALATSETD